MFEMCPIVSRFWNIQIAILCLAKLILSKFCVHFKSRKYIVITDYYLLTNIFASNAECIFVDNHSIVIRIQWNYRVYVVTHWRPCDVHQWMLFVTNICNNHWCIYDEQKTLIKKNNKWDNNVCVLVCYVWVYFMKRLKINSNENFDWFKN